MLPKILFICKQRNDKYGASFGLINSCQFVCNALTKYNIEAKTVMVVDNNGIDKEVHNYKPTHVFIEALWVVPEKFNVLIPLHPTVKWHIRLHSRMPFLANEGIAIDWLRRYYSDIKSNYPENIFITANNTDLIDVFKQCFDLTMQHYPNIYSPPAYENLKESVNVDTLEIGCFGAIRPMKNHAYQAAAAIVFGNQMNKNIRFHINSDRIEQKGGSVLKNIENMFKNTNHELVKHEWMPHEKFIELVKTMNIGMQVSFSESFNIVAADFVYNDIPLVGSPEINWLNSLYKANPNDLQSIVETLYIAHYGKRINLHWLNKGGLNSYNKQAISIWMDNLNI